MEDKLFMHEKMNYSLQNDLTIEEEECINVEYIETKDDNDEINELQNKSDKEQYQCNACKISFTDVMNHIKNFHKNQSVLIEAADCNKYEEDSSPRNLIEDDYDHTFLEVNLNEHDMLYATKDDTHFLVETNDDLTDHDSIPEELPKEEIDLTTIEELNHIDYNIEADNKVKSEQLLPKSLLNKSLEKFEMKPEICTICNTIFPSMKNLKLHSKMHKPVKTKTSELSNSKMQFFCELCEKSYDMDVQEQHAKFHLCTCNICNKQFKNDETYRLHLTLHEENGSIAFAPLLKKPTKSEKAGIIHPYACQHCGRTFKRPHEKVKHERIHTGEKPFSCDICGKTFRVAYSLTLHQRTHTGIRPYVCLICNKRFRGNSTYAHHLLTHSDERKYKCTECTKTFKTAVQLHGHKNSHIKPFVCIECTRPFASMYAVEVHMESHKKGFKYFCDVCGASYARSFALEEHKKKAHNPPDDVIENHLEYFCNEEIILPECILSPDELFKD